MSSAVTENTPLLESQSQVQTQSIPSASPKLNDEEALTARNAIHKEPHSEDSPQFTVIAVLLLGKFV
jgi:hypothetical protein